MVTDFLMLDFIHNEVYCSRCCCVSTMPSKMKHFYFERKFVLYDFFLELIIHTTVKGITRKECDDIPILHPRLGS